MGWVRELGRFAVHAAAATAAIFLVGRAATSVVHSLVLRLAGLHRSRALALVIGGTLLVRLGMLPTVEPTYTTDVKEYVEKAAAIADHGHPRGQETRPDGRRFYRTLGYSLALSGWFEVTGTRSVRSAQVFGIVVACGVAALILALGIAIGHEIAGRLAALAYAAHLPAALFALLPYTETWATLLLVGAMILYAVLRRFTRVTPLAATTVAALGVLEGWLAITRAEFLWLPAFTGVALLASARFRIGARLGLCAVLLAGFVLPLAVNHQLRRGYYGVLRTSVQSGLILYLGNNPHGVTGEGNGTPEAFAHVQSLYARDPSGALARAEALEWMRAHPLEVVANAPKKLYHLWLSAPQGFGWHVRAGQEGGMDARLASALLHVGWVQGLLVLGLGIVGLAAAPARYRLWIAVLVAHVLVWSLLAASARNRYPLEPLLMLAGAAWLVERAGARHAADPRP